MHVRVRVHFHVHVRAHVHVGVRVRVPVHVHVHVGILFVRLPVKAQDWSGRWGTLYLQLEELVEHIHGDLGC